MCPKEVISSNFQNSCFLLWWHKETRTSFRMALKQQALVVKMNGHGRTLFHNVPWEVFHGTLLFISYHPTHAFLRLAGM